MTQSRDGDHRLCEFSTIRQGPQRMQIVSEQVPVKEESKPVGRIPTAPLGIPPVRTLPGLEDNGVIDLDFHLISLTYPAGYQSNAALVGEGLRVF